MAVGAYAAYKLWLRVPELNILIVVFLFGGLMAAAVGILFGLPSLRIKGFYLAVATLAAQFFLDWLFTRVKWFTNYTPSGSVAVGETSAFGCEDRHAGRALPLHPGLRRGRHPGRQEPGARPYRPLVDGDPRHGHRRRDHRLPAVAHQALGLRRQLLLHRHRRRACGASCGWARGSRSPSTSTARFQVLFMVIIGGLGSLLGSFLGAAFIVLTADPAQPAAGLARRAAVDRPDQPSRIHGVRRPDRLLPDRRAARPGAAVAIAKEKLRLWPFPH